MKFFTKKAMSHEIYFTFYLQGGKTDYHVHRKSTPHIQGYTSFLNSAYMCAICQWHCLNFCVPYRHPANESCGLCVSCLHGSYSPIAGVQTIGIHEIPVPQNQIHSVRQTSCGVRVYETIP